MITKQGKITEIKHLTHLGFNHLTMAPAVCGCNLYFLVWHKKNSPSLPPPHNHIMCGYIWSVPLSRYREADQNRRLHPPCAKIMTNIWTFQHVFLSVQIQMHFWEEQERNCHSATKKFDIILNAVLIKWLTCTEWCTIFRQGRSKDSISRLNSCNKSSQFRFVYSQCHGNVLKCVEQNVNSQSHTSCTTLCFLLS